MDSYLSKHQLHWTKWHKLLKKQDSTLNSFQSHQEDEIWIQLKHHTEVVHYLWKIEIKFYCKFRGGRNHHHLVIEDITYSKDAVIA